VRGGPAAGAGVPPTAAEAFLLKGVMRPRGGGGNDLVSVGAQLAAAAAVAARRPRRRCPPPLYAHSTFVRGSQ